ncbi:MAG: hypothetical protein ACE5NW_12025, partial [Acidiferrobacterales bacterium]
MQWVQQVSYPLNDTDRGALIYAGRLLVFKKVPAIQKLCAFADSLIKETFTYPQPEKAQFQLSCDAYLTTTLALRKRFKQHPEPKQLFAAALKEIGMDLERNYWDRMLLRVLPHGGTHAGGPVSKIGFHRDTWGSNLYQQLNWWAPIYSLTPERTVAFYPYYWS